MPFPGWQEPEAPTRSLDRHPAHHLVKLTPKAALVTILLQAEQDVEHENECDTDEADLYHSGSVAHSVMEE